MKYFIKKNVLWIFILNISCNPIPQKDKHKDVPYLRELLSDKEKFTAIYKVDENTHTFSILQSGNTLVVPNGSSKPFKIFETDKNLIFGEVNTKRNVFYIDSLGNVFINNFKYFYPDYKRKSRFNYVNIFDSLSTYSNLYKDSIYVSKKQMLLDRYNLEDRDAIYMDSDYTIKIVNDKLVNYQKEHWRVDNFKKKYSPVKEFDNQVLVRWDNGKLPVPVYLQYFELKKGLRFKMEDKSGVISVHNINLKNQEHLLIQNYGLFRIN